ncbi:hypothetical protein D3C81_1049310 [compost metagenome]
MVRARLASAPDGAGKEGGVDGLAFMGGEPVLLTAKAKDALFANNQCIQRHVWPSRIVLFVAPWTTST